MDEQYIHRVAKLIPFAVKNKSLSTMAFAYHFEPPVDDNAQLGSFFVTIEIMASQNLAGQLIDLIIKTVGEVYYNQQYAAEPQERFEKALREVNSQVKELFGNHDTAWQSKISAIIGIMNQNTVLLSQAGSATAFLYRKGRSTNLTNDKSKGQTSTGGKVFSSIVTGTLKPLDKILMATPAIMFQFSLTELRTIITDNSPNQAINKLSSALSNQENNERCAAIVIEITTPDIAAALPLHHVPDEIMIGDKPSPLHDAKQRAIPAAKTAAGIAKRAAEKTSSFTRGSLLPKLKQSSQNRWNSLWTTYINPNPKRALIIAISFLIVLSLGANTLFSINPNQQKIIALYQQADQLRSQAEQQLKTPDKKSALRNLALAQDKIDQLQHLQPADNKVDDTLRTNQELAQKSASLEALRSAVNDLSDTAQNIIRVQTKQVADFSDLKSAQMNQFVVVASQLYVVDSSDGSLYSADTESNTYVKVANDSSLKNVVSITPSYSKDSIFFLTNTQQVLQYRISTDNLARVTNTDNAWPSGVSIASYLSNLYILSPVDNQIYKYSFIGTKYGGKVSYVKDDDAQITNGLSMAINGAIFVPKSDGSISYFENGTKKSFDINSPLDTNPSLANIFWVDSSSSLIGLDSAHTRVVDIDVASGTPNLHQQLMPAGISKIDAMFASDQNEIMILSDKKVFLLQN